MINYQTIFAPIFAMLMQHC